jgi:hypothetical protein
MRLHPRWVRRQRGDGDDCQADDGRHDRSGRGIPRCCGDDRTDDGCGSNPACRE